MAAADATRARQVLNSRAYLVAGWIAGGLNKPTKLIFKSFAQRIIDAAENTLEREILGPEATVVAPVEDPRVRQLEAQVAEQARLLEEQSAVLGDQSDVLDEQAQRDDALQREIDRGRAEQDQLKAEFEAMKREAQPPKRPAPFPPTGDGDTDANAAMGGPVSAMGGPASTTGGPVSAMGGTQAGVTSGAFMMMGIGSMNAPMVERSDIFVRVRPGDAPLRYEHYDARVLGAMDKAVQKVRGLVQSSLNQIEHPLDILESDNADAATIFIDMVVQILTIAENLAPTRPQLQANYDRNMELMRHAINALNSFEFRRGDRGKPIVTSNRQKNADMYAPGWNY